MNYFKIAWRSLKKQPFFTFLNTFGLAIGMAGCLLISLYIYDEFSFDKMFADSERIYRLDLDNKTSGELTKYAAVSGPLAAAIREDYPQVEMVTRFRDLPSMLLRNVDEVLNVKEPNVVAVDSSFFDMFGLDLLVGDAKSALKEPNTLILTKTAAEKHFGLNEALGQSLLLDNKDVYIVTGVIDDMPKNSFLKDYTVFTSIESYDDAKSIRWSNWSFPTFVKLRPSAKFEHFQAYLSTVKERYLIPWAMTFVEGLTVESSRARDKTTGNYMKFGATALTDIHLHSPNRKGEFNLNSDIQNVYILSFIGLFLMLLASVNFMNLSTAHSLKRAKEVGVRKTLGSNRFDLVRQFLTEAGLVSFLSLMLALAIGIITLPYFNQLSGKAIAIPFGNPIFWVILVLTTFILGIFSGTYPAFFMSNFVPAKVLKGGGESSLGGGNIRNSLVIFQFGISVFLIVGTLVVYQQLNYIQSKDLGYNKNQIIIIDDVNIIGSQVVSFKQEVQQLSQVESMTISNFLPTPSARNGTTFFPEGKVFDSESAMIIGKWKVDYDYISSLGMEIIAGRDFDEQFSTDTEAIILNESAVEMLGVKPEEAIGMRLTDDFRNEDKENMEFLTIIGVVKNFHFESLRNNIDAISLSLGGNSNKMLVKLNAGDFSNSIDNIEKTWEKMAPGQPFNFSFMDDLFNTTYEADRRLGVIFITFTILSIFIACLGLFGLAAFNAEKRAKEISIRKVLGASVGQITHKLSIDFLKLVGVAIIISLPMAWYAMNKWLEDFSYRIEISWWILVLAAFLAVTISIVTVSFQSIKAAMANPIKSLKRE